MSFTKLTSPALTFLTFSFFPFLHSSSIPPEECIEHLILGTMLDTRDAKVVKSSLKKLILICVCTCSKWTNRNRVLNPGAALCAFAYALSPAQNVSFSHGRQGLCNNYYSFFETRFKRRG